MNEQIEQKIEEILVLKRTLSDIQESSDVYSGEYDYQLENLFSLLDELEELWD